MLRLPRRIIQSQSGTRIGSGEGVVQVAFAEDKDLMQRWKSQSRSGTRIVSGEGVVEAVPPFKGKSQRQRLKGPRKSNKDVRKDALARVVQEMGVKIWIRRPMRPIWRRPAIF